MASPVNLDRESLAEKKSEVKPELQIQSIDLSARELMIFP